MTSLLDFHFMRPYWLLLLTPLLPTLWWLYRQQYASRGWQKFVNPALLNKLMTSQQNQRHSGLVLLAVAWVIGTVALAGPSWYQTSTPISKVPTARVLLMDMSLSLLATDLKPNRLTQARFKAMDLLDRWHEGDTGLISFAGDAYVLSPLTADINNLKTMLPALDPTIMPALGSRPDKAIAKAIELLQSAGYQQGDLYLIGDEIRPAQQSRIDGLLGDNFRLHILGVGTPAGGPIRMPDGSLLKMPDGELPVPGLDESTLRAAASTSGGSYVRLSASDADLDRLASASAAGFADRESGDGEVKSWHDAGYYFVLLLLPLAALAFRRGLLVALVGLPLFMSPIEQVKASPLPGWLQSDDQKASEAFNKGDFKSAAERFENDAWRAASLYNAGDYEAAAALYRQMEGAEAEYNLGNALAKSGDFQGALEAYNNALAQNPDLTAAATNRQRLLDFLEDQPPPSSDPKSSDPQSQPDQGDNESPDDQQQQDGEGEQPSDSGEQHQDEPDQQRQENKKGQGENQQPNPSDDSADDGSADDSPRDATKDNSPPENKPSQQGSSDLDVNDDAPQQPPSPTPASQEAKKQPDTVESGQEQQETSAPGRLTQGEPDEQAEPEGQVAVGQPGEELNPEDQQLQRWLEQIPDDPSLLLRNKMQLEHRRRQKAGETTEETQLW
ncbi:VWA domain-containing protein [Corallincola platygyrae]|uniref:VWA domain-containing protein n=1 Tax=Corallincola platygyrae TaxID=1193278 RepID=A0ABW4XTG3_9GAMM